MPTIVVEDGTVVSGANSFVSVAEFISFASNRGIDIDTTDDDPDVLLIKAMDDLVSKESQFKGSRVDEDQTLPFPREDVWMYGYELLPTELTDGTDQYPIPQELKNAQMQIALYLKAGIDLAPITNNNLKRKKTGPLEREYFQGGSQPYLKQLDTWLAPLLKSVGILSVGRS